MRSQQVCRLWEQLGAAVVEQTVISSSMGYQTPFPSFPPPPRVHLLTPLLCPPSSGNNDACPAVLKLNMRIAASV